MKRISNLLSYVFIVMISFIVALSFTSSPFSNKLHGHDSSMFLYFGYGMERDLYMYKDIFDHKGPVLFFINYLAVKLGKYGLFIVEYIFLLLFFYYVYKTARLWLNNLMSILTMVVTSMLIPSFYEGGNLSEPYAVPFIMLAIYIFSKYFIKNDVSKIEIIILGIVFSIVFLLRPNMVSVWIAFIFIILCKLIYQKYYKKIFQYTVYFVIGIALVFLPIILYFSITNSLFDAIYQIFTYNIIYLSTSEYYIFDVISNQLIRPEIVVFFIFLGSSIYINKLGGYELAVYFSIAVSGLSIIMSKRYYAHYLVVIIPLFAILVILVLRKIKIKQNKCNFKLIIASSMILLPIYISILKLLVVSNLDSSNYIVSKSSQIKNEIYARDYKNEQIHNITSYIKKNTNYEDKIYAHRTSGILYLESERLANTKYFNLPAADITNNEKIKSEFFNDMNSKSAKIIILNRDFIGVEQEGFEQEFKEYINENYILDFENEVYLAYKQK